LKLSTVLVKNKNNIRVRICFKTNTKAKTLSLLNLQLLDSRDHDLWLKDYVFAAALRPLPSTIPTVLLDIKGTIPIVHKLLRHRLVLLLQPIGLRGSFNKFQDWHPYTTTVHRTFLTVMLVSNILSLQFAAMFPLFNNGNTAVNCYKLAGTRSIKFLLAPCWNFWMHAVEHLHRS